MATASPSKEPVSPDPKIPGFVKLAEGKGGVLVGGPMGETAWMGAEDAKGYDLAEPGRASAPFPDDEAAVLWEGERVNRYLADPAGDAAIHALRHSRFGWVVVSEGK